jgi:hypothetical protein
MLMARRPSAALAALALGTLAACSDLTSPDALLVQDGPGASLSQNADGLPVLGSAKVNAAEPADVNPANFDILLRFAPGMTDAQKAYFEIAAARWEALIRKDVPSITGTLPGNASGTIPVFTGTVDDILIDARIGTIDGPGKILGSAGPRFIRNVDILPVSGSMNFDVVDIQFLIDLGLFDEVIVHEMGHVLGIGTLWNVGRALRVGTVSVDPRFVGKHANLQYAEIGGIGLLQVENTGGGGTAGAHWRESTYKNELMTGFLNLGVNPVSRFTAGSLRDLGYQVNMAAEEYSIPVPAPAPATANVLATPGVSGIDIAEGEELLAPEAVIQ